MSMSYSRGYRSSLGMGYDTSLSTSSGLGSRSLSSYGTSSSSYGLGSSSLGSSGYRSLRTDTSSSRSGLYSTGSSISPRSSYADPVPRRSSYLSSSTYSNTSSLSDSRGRDSNYGNSSSIYTSDRYGSFESRRRGLDSYSTRSSRVSEASPSNSADTSSSLTSSKRKSYRRSGEWSSVDLTKSDRSATDSKDNYVQRRGSRKNAEEHKSEGVRRRSSALEQEENNIQRQDSIVSSSSRHSGDTEKTLSRQNSEVDSKENENEDDAVSDSSPKLDKGDVFDDKLASYVRDCDTRSAFETQKTNNSNFEPKSVASEKPKGSSEVVDKNTVVEDEKMESKQLGLSSASKCRFDVKHSKNSTLEQADLREEHPGRDIDSRTAQANSFEDQTRKPRVNGTIKATISTRPTSSATSPSQKEIERLTSLCESRTKELTHTKMQLKATTQGFDAMAVLVNYCCAELDAFECPALAKKLETVQRQLTDCLSQIADLTSQKEMLDKNLAQVTQEKEEASKQVEEALKASESEKESHAKQTSDMDKSHNAALTTQRDDLNAKHEEALKKNRQYYDRQIELLKQAHERQISDMKNESKLEMNGIRISHLEEIQELRNKHDSQMEELHKQHRNKLEDITHRFESIKLTLSEKVESLRGECDDLRHRARSSEEALQRDADVKVQMALTPFLNLPKEIESLKTVVEMRNEEIQRLRTKNMDLEKQLEEIPIGREKIISLQQKVENLEAIINIKTDHEKQLHEKCQILMRKYDREARANKRLSMDYEQVMWRMSQSSEFGSCESLTKRQLSRSPPRSERGSPESRNRNRSPNASGDVVMRKKRNSKSASDSGERRIRCRSETFVCEKHESSDSHSPSSSPQPKQKKLRNTLQPNGNGDESDKNKIERMCKSAGPEVLSDMSRDDETWVEQEDGVALKDMCDSQGLKTSSEMANSYARSVSGVSDSGVYDSLSRSELLNSSIVSTDSEWASASANLSMTLDSTMDDFESGPRAGDYSTLNNSTVVHQDGSISETSSNASLNSVGKAVSSSTKQNHSERNGETSTEGNSYSFQVSIPEDSVFDEKATIETYSYSLTDPEGHNVSDSKAIMEGLSANNPDCDVSVSVSQPAANAELTSSPIISSDKSA